MKPKVYLETSIVSYLAARSSRDLITAANQQLTHDWWDRHRFEYELYASTFVLEEAKLGDVQTAQKRVNLLQTVQILEVNDAIKELSRKIINRKILPAKASVDVSHIAVATIHKVDYLLTWNCKHIANPQILRRVEQFCREAGYESPMVCTPQEILGVENADVER